MKNQYREALERARREGKTLLVGFTGYACTNCHWMKANMFTRPEIAGSLGNFILLELYTDGTDEASRQNQEMQLAKFQTVAIPFYALIDGNEKTIETFPGLTKDATEFAAFLQKGATSSATPAAVSADAGSGLPQGLTKLDGTPVNDLGGRVVVVNFWATWCVPCIQEIPGFNKLHASLGAKDVSFLGVSMDEDGPEKVKSFLKKHPITYPVAMGSEKLSAPYKLDQLPVTIVFDRNGKPVKRFEGFTAEADLEQSIRALL
jgi:thiol:disulfide interchange protein DsbD